MCLHCRLTSFFAHVVTFFRLKERESHLLCKENQARKKMFLFWHTNQADLLVTQWTIARLKARLLFLSNREWTLWGVLKINTSVTLVRLTHFRSFVQHTKLRSFIHWRVQITELNDELMSTEFKSSVGKKIGLCSLFDNSFGSYKYHKNVRFFGAIHVRGPNQVNGISPCTCRYCSPWVSGYITLWIYPGSKNQANK